MELGKKNCFCHFVAQNLSLISVCGCGGSGPRVRNEFFVVRCNRPLQSPVPPSLTLYDTLLDIWLPIWLRTLPRPYPAHLRVSFVPPLFKSISFNNTSNIIRPCCQRKNRSIMTKVESSNQKSIKAIFVFLQLASPPQSALIF